MAIVISGINNNDKITASDGTIDLLSGVSYAGIITAPAFTSTGNLTAASINVGNNIQVGNTGIITATTLVGNVTGNVNHTSNLLLQISGSEKLRIANRCAFGLNGTNYGSSGQVLTSQGSGSSPVWSTITGTTINTNDDNRIITGSDTANTLNGESTLTYDGTNMLLSTTDGKIQLKDGNNYIQFVNADKDFKFMNAWGAGEFTFHVNGGERLRIASAGQIGLGGANYGSSGQVLTSQGGSSAPQWATPTNATASPSTGGGTVSGQRVASDLTYSSGSNGTNVQLGNVSNCSASSVYALEISLTYMHNGSTNHCYLTCYIYQRGKTYGTDGVYFQEQHYDWYYNYTWTRAILPWDPSGTQALDMYIQNAYNTNSGNKFYVDISNKLQNI